MYNGAALDKVTATVILYQSAKLQNHKIRLNQSCVKKYHILPSQDKISKSVLQHDVSVSDNAHVHINIAM